MDWVLAIDNALIGKFILAEDFRRGVEAVLVRKTGVPPPEGWMPKRRRGLLSRRAERGCETMREN